MTNRPKAIGTAGESAVRNFLNGDGWPECHRIAQTGRDDCGDLLICERPFKIIAEVKSGAVAEAASSALIWAWLEETERETPPDAPRRHPQRRADPTPEPQE